MVSTNAKVLGSFERFFSRSNHPKTIEVIILAKMSQPHSSSPPTPEPETVSAPRLSNEFNEIERLYRMFGRYAFSLAKQNSPNDQAAEEIVHEAYLKYWNGNNSSTFQTLSSVSFFGWLMREVQENCKERFLEFKTTINQKVTPLRSEGKGV